LADLGITVIAASVGPLNAAQAMADENGFTFPTAYAMTDLIRGRDRRASESGAKIQD
jgi:hypothetical protein